MTICPPQFETIFPAHGLRHSWRAAAAPFAMHKRTRDADGAEALLERLGDLGISPSAEQRELPAQARGPFVTSCFFHYSCRVILN